MRVARGGAAACLLLLLSIIPLTEPSASPAPADDRGVAARYGTVVDSIIVTGNRSTKEYVILRELETRPGSVLEPRAVRRDINFVNDLSPFAKVEFSADSIAPGRSVLRIHVTERSGWLVNSVLPFVKYDFEEGLTYGLRWNDKNFRGRLEQLDLSYTRNERDDEDMGFGWFAPWIGWRHIGVGGRVSYFTAGDTPAGISVLERSAVAGTFALPLTKSRIKFSQFQGSLALEKTRNGGIDEETTKETTLSPQAGFLFDSRDGRLRPKGGQFFFVGLGASYPLEADRDTFYRLRQEIRLFFPAGERSTIALLSNFFYQFGDFPDYARVRIGGAESLRGLPSGRFSGFHRWYQTAEWRYLYLPKLVFSLPIVHDVDVGLGFVAFVDGGIVWADEEEFDWDHFHGSTGVGIRFYSPLRDVVRLDFGFNASGDARFHFATGPNF